MSIPGMTGCELRQGHDPKGKAARTSRGREHERHFMSAVSLWDGDLPPMVHPVGDTARVRRNDPLESHQAADSNNADDRSEVERIVLERLTVHPSTDSELVDWYFLNAQANGWPVVHMDSPRKRRSDLSNKGLVVATNVTRLSPSGRSSRVFGAAL